MINDKQRRLLEDAEPGTLTEAQLRAAHGALYSYAYAHHKWVRRGAGDVVTLTDTGRLELTLWRKKQHEKTSTPVCEYCHRPMWPYICQCGRRKNPATGKIT